METSITSQTISQQTICGEPENLNQVHEFIEISNDNELKQAQSKEHITEIEQMRKNLIHVREVYLNIFHPKKWLIQNILPGGKQRREITEIHSQPPSSSSQLPTVGKMSLIMIKKKKMRHFQPGTQALKEIQKIQKSTELLIPKAAFWRLVKEVLQIRIQLVPNPGGGGSCSP